MHLSAILSAPLEFVGIHSQRLNAHDQHSIQSGNHLAILYITKGNASYTLDNLSSPVKKYSCILMNINATINLHALSTLEYTMFTFTGVGFTATTQDESQQPVYVVSDQLRIIKHYLNLIVKENETPFSVKDFILTQLLRCVLTHLMGYHTVTLVKTTASHKQEDIEILKKYIRQHYMRKITLEELATLVDINKYYLIRLFKQHTHFSPIDYLIHIRLEEAERMLLHSDLPITQISSAVGFKSPSYFTKTFKEQNDCTPSEYRQRFAFAN
ncbi:AraC family transcriptional regulator [Aerococcaceae bacterium NML160702]|nr:AraC family transcriptional regulator [Aerococcaceae bacterium NML160702]